MLRRQYTAVENGKRTVTTGPEGLVDAVPLPAGPATGCALLPGSGAPRSAALSLDAAGRPQSLTWTAHGHAASLTYSNFQAAAAGPVAGTVVERVESAVRLQVEFRTVEAHTFTEGDFALPPRPAKPARLGGGQ